LHVLSSLLHYALHRTGDGLERGLVVALPSRFAPQVTEVGVPNDGSGVPPPTPADMALLHRLSVELLGDEILGPPGTLPD